MRYVLIKTSGYYYNPTKAMRKFGLHPESLGTDPIKAKARSDELTLSWDNRHAAEGVKAAPRPGSVKALIAQLCRPDSNEWKKKSTVRKRDLERSFKVFNDSGIGDSIAKNITPTDCEKFYEKLEAFGAHGQHDIYKDLRYLLNYAGRVRFEKMTKAENPTYIIKNTAPKARTQKWTDAQVAQAIEAGWNAGYHGAATAVAIMYDTSLRPVDCRQLPPEHIDLDGCRVMIPSQSKTLNPHWTTLWPETVAIVRRYIAAFGATSLPGQPIIRTRTGVRYTQLQLGRDIRKVMNLACIPKEIQSRDLRRTAQYERATSGATSTELGAAAGQKVTSSQDIIDTYVPADFALAKAAQDKRGRRLKK